ncbi:MAG TPA: cupin domain-containing protein [Xanthomonadales bacterium]|nr:cupin domain-containing protein [Xanthomonadales bacterium]
MKGYLLLFLILVCPLTHAHEIGLHDEADQAVIEGTGDFYKSTKDVPYEFADIEGGGTYGAVRLSFTKTDAVGMVGKYRSSKGVQFTRHTHTDWVVVTVLSGKVEVSRHNGADIRVYNPGDSYLVEPGETHTETSLEDTEVVVVNGPSVNNEKFIMRTINIDSADK